MNTYILNRLKRTYKLKGFKGVASTLFNYFSIVYLLF